jgi:hypothetical protein
MTMKLTILSLILASLAFGQTAAKVCITGTDGKEQCREITTAAWASTAAFAAASCKTDDKGTNCQYVDVQDVLFLHLRGYLGDLQRENPTATVVALKVAVTTAQAAVDVELAKPTIKASATGGVIKVPVQ